MTMPARSPMTAEAYLAFEATSSDKHEFVRGELFAMSGTTDTHNDLVLNVCNLLRAQVASRGCRVHFLDLKLRIERADAYFYPDVLVTCDDRDQADRLVKRHASLVVEVLSDSTRAYDQGDKFALYRQLDSLQAYVLVDTLRRRIEVYERQSSPFWRFSAYDAGESAHVEALDVRLEVDAIYEGTDVVR